MASAADNPLQKIPRKMAKQLLVTDTRLKNSLSHPMYKLWWRKINDHAGQEFMIKNLEEKEGGEKDAKEHAKKLPELKEMVEAKITKLEEELATLQDESINDRLESLIKQQNIGGYMLSPSIFHRGSDTWFHRNFPNGLTTHILRDEIAPQDWDFAIYAWLRASGSEVTAHGSFGGSDFSVQEALSNAEQKGLAFPKMAAVKDDFFTDHIAARTPDSIVKAWAKKAPLCLGGSTSREGLLGDLEGIDNAQRRGWTALVAYSAAVGVHEQYSNGGWDQVTYNILNLGGGNIKFIFYALAGCLLVGDDKNAQLVAGYFLSESATSLPAFDPEDPGDFGDFAAITRFVFLAECIAAQEEDVSFVQAVESYINNRWLINTNMAALKDLHIDEGS